MYASIILITFSQNNFLCLQRWVHKAKRILEREGLNNSSSNNTKITPQKSSSGITNSLVDSTVSNK